MNNHVIPELGGAAPEEHFQLRSPTLPQEA